MSLHITITADRRHLASLKRKLEPKQFAKILFGVAHDAAKVGAVEVRSEHWDLGATTRPTLFEATSFGARVFDPKASARPVEFGRHAGTQAPPASALQDWATRHGMQGLEFVIARAIRQRGIKGRFFMRRTKERLHTVVIPELIHKAVLEIHAVWSRE